MIKQDISENLVNYAYISIGSNLGNRFQNINLTKINLMSKSVKILKTSSNYETLSWPDPKMPKFINAILLIKTSFSAKELLNYCQSIEIKLGRKRFKKNNPRTCDIDIIDFNNKVFDLSDSTDLKLPHIAMQTRNFVLVPLYEISKKWTHPQNKKNIKKLINSLKMSDLRAIKQL